MLDVMRDHVPVDPVFVSTLNPVIGTLPLFDGKIHESFTVFCEIIVALRLVGGSGNAWFCGEGAFCGAGWLDGLGADDVLVGVTETKGEGLVSDPADSNAVTAKVYVLPVVRFGTV